MATEKGQKDKQRSTKHAVKNKTDTIWRYQSGNQNPYIEEQTTQWPKEKGQKNKQWSKIEMSFTMMVKSIGLMIIPYQMYNNLIGENIWDIFSIANK
jgi:hypothetical protein